jgi:hypothetical protein
MVALSEKSINIDDNTDNESDISDDDENTPVVEKGL